MRSVSTQSQLQSDRYKSNFWYRWGPPVFIFSIKAYCRPKLKLSSSYFTLSMFCLCVSNEHERLIYSSPKTKQKQIRKCSKTHLFLLITNNTSNIKSDRANLRSCRLLVSWYLNGRGGKSQNPLSEVSILVK